MFLDELRAVRANVLATSKKEIPVPGSGGKLVVRFKPPATPESLTGIVAGYRAAGSLNPDQEQQFLVDCCDEVLTRNDAGELVQPDDAGPLRFDAGDDRWGEDIKTARECVAKLYNLDQQPLALSGIADALFDWLVGVDAEIKARVEGKSVSGATS